MVLGVEYSGTARTSLPPTSPSPPPIPSHNHSKKKRGTQPVTNERLGLGLAWLWPWWGHSPTQRPIYRCHAPQHAPQSAQPFTSRTPPPALLWDP